ncbi:Primary amine oxidase 2 [Glycine max]|nr:Primary amine oxidase 2 [Glycine max]
MPLEGITVVADLDETKIVEYFDRKIAPVPKAEGTEYVASNQKSPFGPTFTGATFVQPNGLGFKINGHSISWANWEFHVGYDIRARPVISLASIYDIQQQSGEFGFGQSMVSLEPLADWPSNAAFLDAYFAGEDGVLVKTTNAFCVFQKYAGDIMWRHIESEIHDEEIREVRPNVSLVVRIVSMVGNYDCIIDWEFKPSGSIKIGVCIIQIKV